MTSLGVASPAWLVLLAGLLPIAWSAWRARGDGRRALAAGALRALALAAVVLALAGLSLERPEPAAGACVVAVVDVSESVAGGGAAAARAFLERLLAAAGPAVRIGSVAFAGRARVVAHPAHGPHALDALVPPALDAAALEPGDTNLAAALSRAAALCPADRHAALVLFSDGNETTGDVAAEIAVAAGAVPVHVVVPPVAAAPAATVRRVIAPAIVPAHATVPVDVVLEARARTTAALEVRHAGVVAPPLPLDLPEGVSVVTLPLWFPAPGTSLVAARLVPPADAPDAPRPPAPPPAGVTVTGGLRVLLASARESPVVGAALAAGGLAVSTVRPAALAARAGRLDDYHFVVLDDVASADVAPDALDALRAWVARGGGLLVTGGPHLFGDAGFVGGPLERVIPVTLQSQKPEPRRRDPIALYVIIDRSNSMGYASGGTTGRFGDKMEYAKRAALAVLEQLGPSDLVGAIAFDAQPYRLGPLQPLAQGGAALVARIRALQYGGGTDFKQALETALAELAAAESRVRHVILLTDGDTNRRADDHLPLVEDFARAGISITTVRIGADAANVELLQTIAARTGGEFHHVETLEALPQLMIRDAQRRVDMAADRRDAVARFAAAGPFLAGVREEQLPPVARWAATRLKPGAELRLYVERDGRREPILATWQYGLGRVAVLPLDFQAGAAGWAVWPGFGRLLGEVALWAAPPGLPGEHRLGARHAATGTRIDLETLGDAPGPFAVRVPGRGEFALRPVGPRRFTAVVPRLPAGRRRVALRTRDGVVRATVVVPPATSGREHRTVTPNTALLARLAGATGGSVAPHPERVIAAPPGTARATQPLATWLVPLALVLTLAEIAIRR